MFSAWHEHKTWACGRAVWKMEPPFLLCLCSIFPSVAGRPLWATSQAAGTICLGGGNRSSVQRHTLNFYAFYNICAGKMSRWLHHSRVWVSGAKGDNAATRAYASMCVRLVAAAVMLPHLQSRSSLSWLMSHKRRDSACCFLSSSSFRKKKNGFHTCKTVFPKCSVFKPAHPH